MKKVTAFIASQQKHATYNAVREFEKDLKSYGDIDFEYVFLKDYPLEYCRGCKLCFLKGEENCPLSDARNTLMEKMLQADGVIFASPNYSFQVAAPMKNLLDRLSFFYHRPRFFGKAFTSIVAQGFFGGGAIVRYLSRMGENFGFSPTKGCVLKALEPMTESAKKRNARVIGKTAARFYKKLTARALPRASLRKLIVFRMGRTSVRNLLKETDKDYQYYQEKGWLTSNYFYPVSMNPVKRLAGGLFDAMGNMIFKQS